MRKMGIVTLRACDGLTQQSFAASALWYLKLFVRERYLKVCGFSHHGSREETLCSPTPIRQLRATMNGIAAFRRSAPPKTNLCKESILCGVENTYNNATVARSSSGVITEGEALFKVS